MGSKMTPLEFALPVHIDYTTLYGAARAIEPSEVSQGHLPFARLLALSQFVESLVIHDQLQFEVGTSPDWRPFQDALHSSRLMRLVNELGLPVFPFQEQVDAEDDAVLRAARWATQKALTVPIAPVAWAVRFRSGTFDGVSNIVDASNPMLDRWLTIIKRCGDNELNQKTQAAMARLSDNHVGPLGFHVLMRIRLLESYLVEGNIANYLPHFSRQPLIVATQERTAQIKRWSIDMIRSRREELLVGNEPEAEKDALSIKLSPVLLACMAKAKHPEDIIDQAIALRETKEARDYRQECRNVAATAFAGDEALVQEYKLRVRKKLQALKVALSGEEVRDEYVSQCGVRPSLLNLFIFSAVRRTIRPAGIKVGDHTSVFLNRILNHAMGVISSQQRLSEIYGIAVDYDADVLTWED